MSSRVSFVALAGLLAACANPVNERTADNYFAAGARALAAGGVRARVAAVAAGRFTRHVRRRITDGPTK
jgi:hypothetical protein